MITDPETKYVITCRDVAPTRTVYKLFWRAIGKGSKPLPRVGQRLSMHGGFTIIVEKIDPPGTPVEDPPPGAGRLIIR